jgi:hypothetical protein
MTFYFTDTQTKYKSYNKKKDILMIKSTMYIATAILALGFGSANAETFNFEGKNDTTVRVGGVGADGIGYVGTYSTGSAVSTNADGSKLKSTNKCVSMMQPPNGNIFAVHVACDVTRKAAVYSVAAGCNFMNKEKTETSCVGGLKGKAGELEGRTGSITWHTKGGISKGTGQWHE